MNERSSKTNIELKIKKKPLMKLKNKDIQYKTLKNILNYKKTSTSKNSNIKSNIYYKSKKEIQIPNNSEKITKRKNYNKLIINNTTNEDKDLEALLSELKITFNQKKVHNNNNENYLNINKYKNKFSLLTNEDLTIEKKEENNNNFDYIDFHFDLEDEGNEISQRVHKKNPKNHFTMENKEKYLNAKKISLNLMKNIQHTLRKEYTSRQNKTNGKEDTIKKFLSSSNNKKSNLIKYKTFKNKVNSVRTLEKFNSISYRKNNKLFEKAGEIHLKKKLNKLIINLKKNHKNPIIKKPKSPNKSEICSPKDFKVNKTLNYETNGRNNTSKLKNMKINSLKKIGDLYIKNNSIKIKNDKNKVKILNLRKNNTNINPFNNVSYEIEKFPIIKKVNYYIENIYDKTKIKNLYVNNNENKKSKIAQYYKANINLKKHLDNSK